MNGDFEPIMVYMDCKALGRLSVGYYGVNPHELESEITEQDDYTEEAYSEYISMK